jgi:tetratricopeptide (TPR) repeat protein
VIRVRIRGVKYRTKYRNPVNQLTDGYAFCAALNSGSFDLLYEDSPSLRSLTRSATFLIRGAIFRRKKVSRSSSEFSLRIRPLGELIEMYHTRKAGIRHDKVFALLGMSDEEPKLMAAAGLLPDYEIPWERLLEQLVRFILGGQVSVKTWAEMEMAVIKSKGHIIGKVSSEGDVDHEGRLHVAITAKDTSGHFGRVRKWTLQTSAKPIKVGDLVCLLHGASKSTIIRPCNDYFSIVMIAVPLLQLEQPITSSPHNFLLVWDWAQEKLQNREEYEAFINRRVPAHLNREVGGHLDKITRLSDVVLILRDAEQYEKAEERLQGAVEGYERRLGKEDPCKITGMEEFALIHKKMKKFEEAEKMFEQVIQMRKRAQGADHPDTRNSIANLVLVYQDQGDFERAEKFQAMVDILDGKWDDVPTMEEKVIKIARSFKGTEVMGFLLDWKGNEVQITESMVIAAAENKREVIKLFLDRKGNEVHITEGAVCQVMKLFNEGIVRLLLDRKWNEIQITESMVIAAVENERYKAGEVIRVLLDQRGNEVQITEAVVIAAGSGFYGREVIELLLDQRGDEVQITEAILIAAVRNVYSGKVVRLLLNRRGNEVRITEAIVLAAAGNKWSGEKVMGLLLDLRGYEVRITEAIVLAAAGNEWSGEKVMRLLLDRRRDEIRITEAIVLAVAGNKRRGEVLMRLLLDRKGNEGIEKRIVRLLHGWKTEQSRKLDHDDDIR